MPKRKLSSERYKDLDSLLQAERNDAKNKSATTRSDTTQSTNEKNASSTLHTSDVSSEQAESPDTATQTVSNKSAYAARKARSAYKPRNRGAVVVPTPGKQQQQSNQAADKPIDEQSKQEQQPVDEDLTVKTVQNEQKLQSETDNTPPAVEKVHDDRGQHGTSTEPEAIHDGQALDDEESEFEPTAKRPSVKIEAAPSNDALRSPEHNVPGNKDTVSDVSPNDAKQDVRREQTPSSSKPEAKAPATPVAPAPTAVAVSDDRPPNTPDELPTQALPSFRDELPTQALSPTKAEESASQEVLSQPIIPMLPQPGMTPDQDGWHRVRINRILIRRRRERLNQNLMPRLVTLLLALFIIFSSLASGGVGAAYAYYNAQLPLLNGVAQHSLFQTTHIYDRNGKLLYELYDQQIGKGRRTYVNYSDIPQNLVDATVAAEDHTFWTNDGVDLYGITRAAISNLQSHGIVEGGSTVTQQLIKKQLFDDQERTFQVKGEEAILALGLTRQYPKWKIMEMYLNTVYYGDINYGVEAAAQDYFGLKPQCTRTGCKPAVAQLDLAQASLLAGLPQSPSYYNPIINKSVALQRQEKVLQAMVQLGQITPEQSMKAQQETQKFKFKSYSSNRSMQAPHFVSYIIDQVLIPLLGAQNLADGGYSIYTTIDLDLEKKVEQIVYDHLYKPQVDSYLGPYGPLYQTNNVNNGAAVVINPRNGEILAMDGSANYQGSTPQMRGFDNAATALRQPGSSFKPVVYATAFEMGWYPAMIVPDHKTIYPADPPKYYSPQNYDGTFHTGYPMTIRTAIANSFNIPAIDTLMFTGIPNVLNMASRLGLSEVASRSPSTLGPSMAIGATEASLLHMTSAYATFANQGVHIPPTSILQINDNQGKTIYHYNESHPQGARALGADVSYLINSMLSDKKARYHEFSPGNPLELDRPAAAKTGTTDSFRDNWTIGYTPYLTAGVWAGNSDNSIMNNIIGITGAGPIWHDIMEYASQHYHFPPNDFVRPPDVHQGTVSALTGLAPRPGEPTVSDWFIDGTLPTMQGNYYYEPPRQICKNRDCPRQNQPNKPNH
jgi:membrane peptidoglycan carboxypeptidase